MRYGGDTYKMSLISEFKAAVAEKGELVAQIAGLKEKLAASDAKLSDALTERDAAVQTLKEKLSEIDAFKASAEASIKSLTEAKAAAEKLAAEAVAAKDVAEANAKHLVENPSAVALEIAAKAGVKPEERPSAKAEDKPKLKGFQAVQASIEAELKKTK